MTQSSSRTALITGAAGGLGQSIARRLAQDGMRLILTDVMACDQFIDSAGLTDSVALTATCDLSSESEVERFLRAVDAQGTVDVLVNNAAYLPLISFDDLTPTDLALFLRINVSAPFQLAKAVSVKMRKQAWGRIINVVSGSAWLPSPNFLGYISSKMGLVGLTRSLAVELGQFGISVNAITPGLTRHVRNHDALPDEFWEMIKNRQAIKRASTPEDFACGVSFLASEDAAFMTGQTVAFDGGLVFL